VTTSVQKGGAGAHVLALHNGINQTANYISCLLAPRDKTKGMHRVAYSCGPMAARFNFLKTKYFGLDSYFEPLWMRRFKELVPRYDIIHLHHLQGYFFDLRSLAFLQQKNVVLTLHDVWPLTGRCSVLTSCDLWTSHCDHCPRRDVYPAVYPDTSRFLHQKKKQLFGGLRRLKIVVLSRYAEDLLKQSYLRDKEYVIIPPGIDLSIFRPQSKSSSGRAVLGVMAAKPGDELKGFDVVMNLIKALARRPENVLIHIVGALDARTRRRLASFPFVRCTPFVAREEELARLYNSFDVFLNFSRQETFGKTVIEAQACGVPVLARSIPAFTENVRFGERVSDMGVDTLLATIDKLRKKNWNRELMHRSMQRYSIENLVDRYLRLYNSFDEHD